MKIDLTDEEVEAVLYCIHYASDHDDSSEPDANLIERVLSKLEVPSDCECGECRFNRGEKR